MTEQDWCFLAVFLLAIGLFLWNTYLANEISTQREKIVTDDKVLDVYKKLCDRGVERESEYRDMISDLKAKLERYQNLVANLNEDVNGEVKQTY